MVYDHSVSSQKTIHVTKKQLELHVSNCECHPSRTNGFHWTVGVWGWLYYMTLWLYLQTNFKIYCKKNWKSKNVLFIEDFYTHIYIYIHIIYIYIQIYSFPHPKWNPGVCCISLYINVQGPQGWSTGGNEAPFQHHQVLKGVYLGTTPPPSNSHHQDSSIFSRESL